MSISVMSEVWSLDLPHNEQSVLLAMADHARDDGTKVYPSIDHIAWKTGYSRSAVHRVIKSILKKGLLVLEREATGGRGVTNLYSIHTSRGVKKPPYTTKGYQNDTLSEDTKGSVADTKGSVADTKGSVADTKGVIATLPEPSVTISNHQEPSVLPAPQEPSDVKAQTSSDDPRQKKTGDGKKARRGKAPKHTPEEIARANEFIAAWMAGFLRATEKPYPMEDKDYRLLYSFLAKNPEPVATFIELASKAWADQYRASWAGSISAFTWNYSKLIMAFREKRLLRSAPRVDPRAVNGF